MTISVRVDQDTAIAAQALRAILEAPGGADMRAGGRISVDTLERIHDAITKLYLLTARLVNVAANETPAPRPNAEYTFEILNTDNSVAAHAVVRWYADDPDGARSAAIAQQAQAARFDPSVRIGAQPIKEVAL